MVVDVVKILVVHYHSDVLVIQPMLEIAVKHLLTHVH